ncbi:hypothetical protein CSA56_19085, partial [candidate division KSB3 bacterium]
ALLTNNFQYLTVRPDSEQRVWVDILIRDGAPGTLEPETLSELKHYLVSLEQQSVSGLVLRFATRKDTDHPIKPADYGVFQNTGHTLSLITQTQEIVDLLQGSPIYSVFIIDRQCPVGGMALAMATHYCIGSLSLVVGDCFPENTLGLHPFPSVIRQAIKRVGTFDALMTITAAQTGVSLPAGVLFDKGFIDEGVPAKKLHEATITVLNKKPGKKKATITKSPLENKLLRFYITSKLSRQLTKRLYITQTHHPAPYALLELWQQYGSRAGTNSQTAFAESLSRLAGTEQAANLQRIARLKFQLKQNTDKPQRLKHLHIIGSDETTCKIASYCLLQGVQVSLQDKRPAALERALGVIRDKITVLTSNDTEKTDELLSHITLDTKGENIKTADMILLISATYLSSQQERFAELEEYSRPDAILATHSSIIPLEKIAAALLKPERLIGIHFCYPAFSTPLVEVSHTAATDEQLLEKACNILKQLNKIPLLLNNLPALLADRVLVQYILQGIQLHQQGVPHIIIDAAARDAGMPSGPLELADMMGLDYCLRVAETMEKTLNTEVPFQLVTMVQTGKLGKKSGTGFYRYRNNNRLKPARLEWDGSIEALQTKLTSCITEEAAVCLEDGLLEDPGLINVGVVLGTGFAPWSGGPLRYHSGY